MNLKPPDMNIMSQSWAAYRWANFQKDMQETHKHFRTKMYLFEASPQAVIEYVEETFPDANSFSEDNGELFFENSSDKWGINIRNGNCGDETEAPATCLEIMGSKEHIKTLEEILLKKFKVFQKDKFRLKWIYRNKGEINSMFLDFVMENPPFEEMYPFLNTSLDQYYKNFMQSNSPILLLSGRPGTGKTSFLRGLLHHSQKPTLVTYDFDILNDDEFFVDFLTNENEKILVVEDADFILKKREDGNTMMSRFLNLSDGLLNFKDKKIIFTTNLDNLDKVDEALLRKGRCFDVLQFQPLTKDQAQKVAGKRNIILPQGSEFTIADIFCDNDRKSGEIIEGKFGFIQ